MIGCMRRTCSLLKRWSPGAVMLLYVPCRLGGSQAAVGQQYMHFEEGSIGKLLLATVSDCQWSPTARYATAVASL